MELKIEGKGIRLRALRKSDARSIQENAKDWEVCRYTILPYPYRLRHAKDFIKKTRQNLRKKAAYESGIELKETGKVIGMMSLTRIDWKNKNAEAGYWLGKKYWGQGIAKEALQLILGFGFRRLKLMRIYARARPANFRSERLLNKTGFKREGFLRKDMFIKGRSVDHFIYSILKEEYQK